MVTSEPRTNHPVVCHQPAVSAQTRGHNVDQVPNFHSRQAKGTVKGTNILITGVRNHTKPLSIEHVVTSGRAQSVQLFGSKELKHPAPSPCPPALPFLQAPLLPYSTLYSLLPPSFVLQTFFFVCHWLDNNTFSVDTETLSLFLLWLSFHFLIQPLHSSFIH